MKQIIVNIDDLAYEPVVGMLKLCQGVEIVSTSEVVETRDVVDRCVAMAIKELRNDDVFKHPGDYTYILLGSNQSEIKGIDYFYTPLEFLDYLKHIGLDHLPGRNTLYDGITRTFGKFPDWTFNDAPKAGEVIRRRNVFSRFLSAYNRARLRVSDTFSD